MTTSESTTTETELPSVRSEPLFDCSVAKTQTFRSTNMVNKTDDMIRVTLDMTRHEWRRMKDYIKQSNSANHVTSGEAQSQQGEKEKKHERIRIHDDKRKPRISRR